MDHIPNHFHLALPKLAMWAWGKPRIASLLYAFIRQVQDLEDAIDEVGRRYTIAEADDARLAVLGKIVGQSRLGAWSTETYRAIIRGRIRTSNSHGRTDDIIEVLRLITETTNPIRVTHLVPAAISIEMPAPVSAEHLVAVVFLLPKARPAGVQLNFIAPTEGGLILDDAVSPLANANTFDNSASAITDAGTFGTAITL